jgi:peptidoglycan/xylan/chitin deacetylase (PgdA/CDA1 family)
VTGGALRRTWRGMRRVLRTRYPGFLFGRPLAPGEIPVFVYHDVEPVSFAADLAFLSNNGYRTLGLDELLAGAGRQRGVVLTFDDARRSFHEVALPALRRFEARAVLCVPTAWLRGPREEDGLAGAEDRAGFMSWEELRAAAASGLVEPALHGHRHALVNRSLRLAGFASPSSLEHYDVYDWPMRREAGQGARDPSDRLGRPAPGTPVYEAVPLFSASRRVLEPAAAAEACRARVAEEGAARFFARPDWEAVLRRVHDAAAGRGAAGERVEGAAFDELVASELRLAQDAFARELGRPARAFAYPWTLGTPRSFELALGLGIDVVFGVATDFRRARALARIRPTFGRLRGDWLRLLPGEGRARLRDVVAARARGFGASQHLAH